MEIEGEQRSLKIAWQEAGVASFANNLLVQSDGNTFYLTFYQVIPPIMMGEPEELAAAMQSMETVPAVPVARVAVGYNQLATMLGVMKRQLDQVNEIRRQAASKNTEEQASE